MSLNSTARDSRKEENVKIAPTMQEEGHYDFLKMTDTRYTFHQLLDRTVNVE